MIRVLAVVAAALVLSGCGASTCAQAFAEQNRIFGSTGSCAVTSGGITITLKATGSQSTCESNISKCNATDQKAMEDWTTCLKGVPACTTGAEQATVDGLTTCAAKIVNTDGTSKLSADCANAIK